MKYKLEILEMFIAPIIITFGWSYIVSTDVYSEDDVFTGLYELASSIWGVVVVLIWISGIYASVIYKNIKKYEDESIPIIFLVAAVINISFIGYKYFTI